MEFNIAVLVGGSLKGQKKVQTPCMIGRSKEAALTVAHPSMSRKHCELYEESGKLYLNDNSSLNGTIYKGEFVESPVVVEIGDEFTVGDLTFRILAPQAPRTKEQLELADKPTAAITATEEKADDDPAMATILEPPKKTGSVAPDAKTVAGPVLKQDAKTVAESDTGKKPETKTGKDSKKVSPTDVRIDIK